MGREMGKQTNRPIINNTSTWSALSGDELFILQRVAVAVLQGGDSCEVPVDHHTSSPSTYVITVSTRHHSYYTSLPSSCTSPRLGHDTTATIRHYRHHICHHSWYTPPQLPCITTVIMYVTTATVYVTKATRHHHSRHMSLLLAYIITVNLATIPQPQLSHVTTVCTRHHS